MAIHRPRTRQGTRQGTRLVRSLIFFGSACCILILSHVAAASGDLDIESGSRSNFPAPDADHLVGAENTNLQRWLRHVRHTTSYPHEHTGEYQVGLSTLEDNAERESKTLFAKRKPFHLCKKVIYVEKDGSGNFTSIQAAINSVPRRNKCRVDIRIGAGVFREKVFIKRSKPLIALKGNSQQSTFITYNDTASSRDKHGRLLGTFYSATVAINSRYFIAKDITFMNTAPHQRPGAVRQQAVALRISGDKAAFFNCRFYAHQDTLYDHRGRHYFKNCFVTGTVDFIFGNARSLYEGAELFAATDYGVPARLQDPKRNETTLDTGFSFVRSRITGAGMVYLGRAWGNDSRVVFANSFMDKIVVPEGWGDWGIPAREKTVYFAQFNCTGPGADMSHRVHWARNLTAQEAAPFLTASFINGEHWLEGYKNRRHH